MKKKSIIFCFLLLSSLFSFSQVSVTSYSIYALGVSVPIRNNFSTELKTFANQGDIKNINMEFSGIYHFNSGDFHRFSAGIGFGLSPISQKNPKIVFPVALEIYPLQSFKQLSFLVELAPVLYFDDNIDLRHLWGIRYTFE